MDIKKFACKHRKKMYLGVSIILLGLGGFVGYLGNGQDNPFVIAFGFGLMAGGFMLFVQWRRLGTVRYTGVQSGEKINGNMLANSINISENSIEFVYTEEPKGQSQKGLNDGKYYHLQKVLVPDNDEGFVAFELPDDDEKQRYYDPTEFANPVTMPSNKKYFTWSASTMQKISIGLMALVIGGELIGLVAMGG